MQLSLTDSLTAKRDGLAQVEAHHQRWVDTMRQYAMEISERSGQVTIDSLRQIADKLGLHPPTPKIWGSIFHGVKWKHIDWQRSAWPSNKGRHIQVWKYSP